MKKINKIIFVIGKLSNGGAERVITTLANRFIDKYEVYIIVMSNSKIDYNLNKKIRVIFLCESIKSYNFVDRVIKKIKKLRKLFKEINPEIIISFLGDINIFTLLASRGIDAKVVVSERNYPKMSEYVNATKYIYNINRILYLFADKIIFQTEEIKQCFSKKIQKKGIIIPNPIGSKLPVADYNNLKKEIVTVARIIEQKNIDLLIQCFIELKEKKSYKDYKLLIYGTGKLESLYRNKYKNYIQSGEIVFCGFQKDIHCKISNSELFVLPSNVEGMPNALMEAMAIGIPSIATDSLGGGVRQISNNGEYVLLSPINNKEALLKNMIKSIENREKSIQRGQKAREYIALNYNIDVIIDIWESVFKDIGLKQFNSTKL